MSIWLVENLGTSSTSYSAVFTSDEWISSHKTIKWRDLIRFLYESSHILSRHKTKLEKPDQDGFWQQAKCLLTYDSWADFSAELHFREVLQINMDSMPAFWISGQLISESVWSSYSRLNPWISHLVYLKQSENNENVIEQVELSVLQICHTNLFYKITSLL